MNHFRTPLNATSVTTRHSSRCATTLRDTGFHAFLNFVTTCKNFVASRRANSEVGLRLRAVLALAVVCGASLFCASSAYAQTTTGIVTAWGYNRFGQCTIPDSANSGVSAIAGGSEHTIALPPIKDCNNNGIHDPVDVAAGAIDLNTDSVPDTCQGLNPYDTTTSSLGIPTANIAVNTTFTGLQPTITDAILTIRAKGDFDAGSAGLEYLTVKINDASPGQKLFETGAVNCSSATNGGVSTATITIPVATFAQYSAAGTLKVTLLPSPSVTASECSTGFITAQLQCVFLTASGDCDSNSQWDLDEIKANPTLDRNTSRTLDFCEIRDNPALDRNNNGQLDSYDISQDPSLDRNLNGQFDSYDISQDPTLDRNNNGVLDSWEIAQNSALDRNNNGVLDSWEISQNPALDRNNNGMLDSYDVIVNPSLDCNNNLAIDQYEILDNSLLDCDANGRLDSCDIASKNSPVFAWGSNGNGQCLGTNSSGSPITSTANGASVQILGVTLSGVSAIAGGADHTIALKNSEVLAWGRNVEGQCTIPASTQSSVIAIAGGYYHTIALRIPVDTNYNSRLDSCEITANAALDRNTNGMLDSFDCAQDPALDCNHNLNIDQYEIVDNELLDCNYNGKIDSCDIANGVADDDSDSHLDVCEWSKGDLDLSGVIDSGDFSILLLYYGEIDPIFGDMDGSGLIDTGDASIILLYFGEVTWP